MIGKEVVFENKTWRIASIRQGRKPWAWLVNTSKPKDQIRLSITHSCFDGVRI